MKIIGVVAEYNPFHLGHSYHLDSAKRAVKADGVVVILSSNFVQRGEPGIVDKWARAQMALAAGVDLVLELPAAFACRSAMWFALGSIKSLHNTGIVTHLAFGAEEDDLPKFKKIAKLLNNEPASFKETLDKHLRQGLSYPRARNLAISNVLEQDIDLNNPNNILTIAYLRTLELVNSNIEPILIKRKGSYHSKNVEEGFLSATAIRQHIAHNNNLWEKYVPSTTKDILVNQFALGKGPVFFNHFSNVILAVIRRLPPGQLGEIIEVEEGLENRVWELAHSQQSLDTLIEKLKTKRYPYTRIQRLLSHIFINFTKDYSFTEPYYLRALGFNKKGKELLKLIKNASHLPLITKFAHGSKALSLPGLRMLELEARVTDLYALGYPDAKNRYGRQDYYQAPIYFEN